MFGTCRLDCSSFFASDSHWFQVFHTFATVFRLLPTVSRLFPGCFSLQPPLTETFAIPTESLIFGVIFDYSVSAYSSNLVV